MRQLIAFLLGLAASYSAVAECIATGYRVGDPIPTYMVLGRKTLADEWDRYEALYGKSAWRTDMSGADRVRPVIEHCLVEVAPIDAQGKARAADREELILQKPCDEFRAGDRHRLFVYAYCVELFGRNPDFFSTLHYRHANITKRKRYGA